MIAAKITDMASSSPICDGLIAGGMLAIWDCMIVIPIREVAEQRARGLIAELRRTAPKLAEWLDATLHETLAFSGLPEAEARRRLRTTNAVEHDHATSAAGRV